MERKFVRVAETQADLLLAGFRLVYIEFLRGDLEPLHMEYVTETLNEIATNCINAGLGENLAKIKEDLVFEQRLTDLKLAYDKREGV